MSARLPGKLRRASVYAAGTPISSARNTTAKTTCSVTQSIESSWNSFHAAVYQLVVQPSGSQVPSQRRANELVATAAIMSPMLTTNSVMRPSSRPRQARSNQVCSVSLNLCPRRPARGRRRCAAPAPPRR